MTWQPVDLTDDTDEPRYTGDPQALVDALADLLALRPAWHASASCAAPDVPIELFFPERGQSTDPAKTLCAACPVQAECLQAGIGEHHGVWGGASERGRRQLRRSTIVESDAA